MSNRPQADRNICNCKTGQHPAKRDAGMMSNPEHFFAKQRQKHLPWAQSPPPAFSPGGKVRRPRQGQSRQLWQQLGRAAGRRSPFLSDATIILFFNISEMFTHGGVSPWDVRVGWRRVGGLSFLQKYFSEWEVLIPCVPGWSTETAFRKVLNKERGWTEEREDERTMLMLVSKQNGTIA